MAFRPIQRGALTDRIRRFFGVVGSYSGQIDEVATPVATIADLTAQPWDTSSQRWYARLNVVFVGTEAAFLWGVKNTSSQLVVLDRLLLQCNKTVNFAVGSQPVPTPAFTQNVLSRDFITTNAGGFETGVNLAPLPTGLLTYQSTVAGANRATTTFQVRDALTQLLIPLGIVIAPNMVAQVGLATAPPAANDYIVTSLWGRTINDPSLSVTP